jgi:hypothetical protein
MHGWTLQIRWPVALAIDQLLWVFWVKVFFNEP